VALIIMQAVAAALAAQQMAQRVMAAALLPAVDCQATQLQTLAVDQAAETLLVQVAVVWLLSDI
jgi:hypothetical protein